MTSSLVIGNIAYAVTAGALLVRDMLWLRVLGALANAGFIVGAVVTPGSPTYAFLAWSFLFLAINLFQITSLILERRRIHLPDQDQDLYTSVFPNLPVGEFRLLLKAAQRRDVSAGTVLAEKGDCRPDVLLVERGAIRLERDGSETDCLHAGDMLGEVAFVAGRPFSSRAVVEMPTRVVAWDRTALNRLFLRRPAIALGFHAAFIGQLRRNTAGVLDS